MSTLEAKREVLALLEEKQARKAARSFDSFVRYIDVPGAPINDDEDCEEFYPDKVTPSHHHELLIKVLQAVADGALKRVILTFPPGTGKSIYASVCFPPYFMGTKPGAAIIEVSYASDLAKKFGRRCRSITRSPEYERVFKCSLTGDNAAVDDWSATNGSTYMAGGILSGITGNRADGLLIDDPIKGREDADSETIRDKTWEAYKSDLRTRLKPHGWIVLILTRWHEDDPAGRILPEDYDGKSGWVEARDGEKWFVVNLPAQCERADDPIGREIGEYLWTEWFSVEHWEQEKISQGPRNWSALYQQRPAPETGSFFLAEWIRWYDRMPAKETLQFYGASDYAVTDGDGDWTVHGVVGIDPDDNIYLVDWWREQTTSGIWIETFIDLAATWKPLEWAEEAGQIRKALGPFIQKRLRERRVNVYRRQYPSVVNKPTRAQSFRALMATGKVYFPKNAPWVSDLVRELLMFRDGAAIDDQVDVCSLFGRIVDRMVSGKHPPPPKEDIKGMEALTLDKMLKDAGKGQEKWRV